VRSRVRIEPEQRTVSLERGSPRTCCIKILRPPFQMRSGRVIFPLFGRYAGWLYLAAVLDLFSRRVGGWALAAHQDETLIETAFRLALLGRHPPAGLLFHADRGSQGTSDAYRAWLAERQVTVSMSRTGNGDENAVTEAFFGTLKSEGVERASFQTRGQAKPTIFKDGECFSNRIRRHSS
jgi:putative transposase